MSYEYKTERPKIFTDEGQRTFLAVRDSVKKALKLSGAVRMANVLPSGDSWLGMAYIDRMVELGELREVTNEGDSPDTAGQNRVFVSNLMEGE